ncbi:Bifunctional folate synthesis protein [Caprobacter fermentans]|uniref:7,8-dihydroneopterin aldolase n=1 Tax=Caproicibacter fermentans TaxID=2576756 RepID=A0A6N8I1Q2_9FIRM|nr:dihydroneopterin aldolase [Caproicibacter fermentans]MVB12036.1 Bifunctional folate synthesis protein [Caproicibacter fermentans]OCN03029.1 dihydroneopterin aldolase [Clostridium sp. W14A]QNK40633.1 dihydroneopterin aldolase [Caproicibacter fermentans]
MDRIIIEDLQVYAYHGVAQEERTIGQMFFVSLRIGSNLERAAASDDVNDTLNYADLCNDVQTVMQSGKCNLIEAAAMNIIQHLFRKYSDIAEISITLKKPWAPMGHHLKYAAVELERKRGDKDEW